MKMDVADNDSTSRKKNNETRPNTVIRARSSNRSSVAEKMACLIGIGVIARNMISFVVAIPTSWVVKRPDVNPKRMVRLKNPTG